MNKTIITAGLVFAALTATVHAEDQADQAGVNTAANATQEVSAPFNATYDEATGTFIRTPIVAEGTAANDASKNPSENAAAAANAGTDNAANANGEGVTRKFDPAAESFTTESDAAAPAAPAPAVEGAAPAADAAAPAADAAAPAEGSTATDATKAQ